MLLKKFRSTPCCIGLGVLPRIGNISAWARLTKPRLPKVAHAPLLFISASACSTLSSKEYDEARGPTRPTSHPVVTSVGVRKIPHEFSSYFFARKASSGIGLLRGRNEDTCLARSSPSRRLNERPKRTARKFDPCLKPPDALFPSHFAKLSVCCKLGARSIRNHRHKITTVMVLRAQPEYVLRCVT